jgi:multidrug efflux pump subunit AcrB
VRGNDGIERPISELAQLELRRGYSEIQRVDQRRAITISANVEEQTNPGEVLANLQDHFLSDLQVNYPFVSVLWEGQKEQDNESMQSLGLGALVAVAAMFVLLTFQLESVLQPLLILYLIPFATAGAIWGHIFMRLDVTLFSVFGMVALMGMVVNDAIVLLDFINARRREMPHEPIRHAILEASRRRIRPVALNTVTSVIGLIPLLADQSFQAQALIPMGVSLVFGLATSTMLGLFILPTAYYILEHLLHGRHDPIDWPREVAPEFADAHGDEMVGPASSTPIHHASDNDELLASLEDARQSA